jgi:type VI secretion system secreted protein Hcp
MAHDAFLQIEGIEARLEDAERPGWIRLRSFEHRIHQPTSGSASANADSGPGRAEHEDFVVLKEMDEASPKLALYCCAGVRVPVAKIDVCAPEDFRMVYFTIEMREAMIKSISPYLPQVASGAVTGRVALEHLSFRYRRIDWSYLVNRSGTNMGAIKTFWDITRNQGG